MESAYKGENSTSRFRVHTIPVMLCPLAFSSDEKDDANFFVCSRSVYMQDCLRSFVTHLLNC